MSQPLFDYKVFGETLIRAELLKRLLPTKAEFEAEAEEHRLEQVESLRKSIAETEAMIEADPDLGPVFHEVLAAYQRMLAEHEKPEDPPTTHCVTCTCVTEA